MVIRKTTNQFIEEAKKKHGDNKYDYSKTVYVNNITKVIIICNEHGEFLQSPSNHSSYGCGCKKCGTQSIKNKLSSNTKSFIEKAKKKHGDNKYDYSKVEYVNNITNVSIICKIHGIIEQSPSDHLRSVGCHKCGRVNAINHITKTTEEFIINSKIIHGNLFDYSKVEYVNNITKVSIICKIHDVFEQSPHAHLNGSGCLKCCIENRKTKTTEQFIKDSILVHKKCYDYSKVVYVNSITKVSIICKIHGEFEQSPNAHLSKNGCNFCVNKTEAILYKQIIKTYPSIIMQFKQEWCKNIRYLPFDFCIPEPKIIIELDGLQHFKQVSTWTSPEEQFETDKFKEKCANENGYSIIRILQEDVFNDKYDWCKELCEEIENLKKENKVVNRYLCKNGEYDKYI